MKKMKFLKVLILVVSMSVLTGCASTYKTMNLNGLNYTSKSVRKDVLLEYKYEVLSKKYKKKELSKGVRLLAVKITNNSAKDLIFGSDIKLVYDDGTSPYIMGNESIYASLKQNTASYLLYLLLSPLQLMKTENRGTRIETKSTPIGLIIGPGLAVGNMITSSSSNKKFQQDLLNHNINGMTIKVGKSISGLLGIRSDAYNAINIKVE
jgi:hypothetical protein